LVSSMLLGCGGSREKPCPVFGKATFQGKPISAGVIRFSNPQAAIDMTADIGVDGAYEVRMAHGAGLPEGTYRVAVMPPRRPWPLGPIKERPKPPDCRNIPEKYRQPLTSGLTLTVKPGDNRFDVDMQP
jgi:hypothetical protein